MLHRIRTGGADTDLETVEGVDGADTALETVEGVDGADTALETAEGVGGADTALETVEGAADRLRLSKRERQALHQLVFGAARLLEGAAVRDPDDQSLCRILRGSKDDTPGAALLALAHGPDEGSAAGGRTAKAVRRLLRMYTRYGSVRATGRLLSGADVMADLNMSEGPEIGRMLDKLETIRIMHDIRTREQARKLLYDDTEDGPDGPARPA